MNEQIAAIERHIDDHLSLHIKKIQDLIKRPSISSENLGIREMANHLQSAFLELGCQHSEVIETAGHPIVFAEYDAKAAKTLIIYMMYDTEAILPGEEWISPPLEAQLQPLEPFGRCIIGRGAINTKGPLQAFLNAMSSMRAVTPELPVNLKFIAEGEEELGSANLGDFIKENRDGLAADALFFPIPRQQPDGRAEVSLSSKRGLIFELECNGKAWGRGPKEFEIHSGQGALIDNPAWRLVEALGTLATNDGNKVLVEGFYEDVCPPDDEQLALTRELASTWDETAYKARYGVDTFIDGLTGEAALKRLMFEPVLGIRGYYSGDARVGDVSVSKAIVPHRAVCKLNVGLVPNQDKADLAEKIRRHLDKQGYEDIIMRLRPGTTSESSSWGRARIDDDIVKSLIQTYEAMDIPTEIWPRSAGGWPGHLFQKYLDVAYIMGGAGHGGRAHSPNEYLVIDGNEHVGGLAALEKSLVQVLYRYALL